MLSALSSHYELFSVNDTLMSTGLVQSTEITEFYESLLNSDWSFSGRRWLNDLSGRDPQRKKNTYQHTPPGNTGRSPRTVQGSQVWMGG